MNEHFSQGFTIPPKETIEEANEKLKLGREELEKELDREAMKQGEALRKGNIEVAPNIVHYDPQPGETRHFTF